MSTFKTQLDELLTDERIQAVENTGNVDSKQITVKFGTLDFREKDFIGTNITRETIFNSIFNRDLNIHNSITLADKIRYALEIISGCADIGVLPTSYIIDLPLTKQGGIYHLHLKDRGHITFMLAHLLFKAPLTVWKMVVKMLDETNCRGSEILIDIKENILTHINSGLVTELSIVDVTTKPMIDKLMNTEVVVRVSIESLYNHKVEMIRINNSNNAWSTHLYGNITIQSLLVKEEEPVLNIDDLYSTVRNLPVFLGERTFLGGIKNTLNKHSGHEDETLMFHVGCEALHKKKFPKEAEKLYTLFEKTEDKELREKMYTEIYEQRITTAELKNLARTWDKVADNPMWDVLVNRITNVKLAIDDWNYPGSGKNITDISPVAPRAAHRFFRMIQELKKELKWGSDIGGLTTKVVNTAIELLAIPSSGDPKDNPVIKNLNEHQTGRAAREKYFYTVLHKTIVKQYDHNKGARESKERKLLQLRAYLSERGFNKRTFDVIDRKRAGTYSITTIDLMTGRGFELGHKVAGAEFTDDNTFLQFPNDNRFNSAHDITNGYWIEYGSWVSEMKEQYTDVHVDAFEDTLTFCELMEDTLI